MTIAKIQKCPRCNLPQEGIYRCQYCGYDLSQNKKKNPRAIRNRLKDIMGALNKERSVTRHKKNTPKDNGGTRSGADRRIYKLMTYYPDKRSGRDRRKKIDRRRRLPKKIWAERRFSLIQGSPSPHRT